MGSIILEKITCPRCKEGVVVETTWSSLTRYEMTKIMDENYKEILEILKNKKLPVFLLKDTEGYSTALIFMLDNLKDTQQREKRLEIIDDLRFIVMTVVRKCKELGI